MAKTKEPEYCDDCFAEIEECDCDEKPKFSKQMMKEGIDVPSPYKDYRGKE